MNQVKPNYHLQRESGCNYDFENDDVISLNVDFSNEEELDTEEEKENSKYELIKYKLSKSTTQNTSQLDSGYETYKFELNPQKYSLEMSTLSSTPSSSSFSSIDNHLAQTELSSNSLNSNLSKLDSSLSYIVKFHQPNHNQNSINKTDSSVFTKISTPSTLSSEQSFKIDTKNKLNRNASQLEKMCSNNPTDCYRLKARRNDSIKHSAEYYKNMLRQKHQEQFRKITRENLMDSKAKLFNSTCNILDLDDYLLVKIFSNLTTIDKLLLQFVCKRFFYIIWSNVHSYKLFKRIEIINSTNNALMFQYFNDLQLNNSNKTLSTKNKIAQFFKLKKTAKSDHNRQKSQQISISADSVLKFLLTKLLNRQTFPVCLCVEMIIIRDNHRLTDRGIDMISQSCPELNYLCLKNCLNVKTNSIMRLVSSCENLKYLNLTGCFNIENITLLNGDLKSCSNSNNGTVKSNSALCKKLNYYLNQYQKNTNENLTNPNIDFMFNNQIKVNYLYLHFIDLSHCSNVTDVCIQNISKMCIYLKNLYLRKCKLITDMSLLYIAKYCINLRELSLSQCNKITDLGVKFLGNDPLLTNSTMNEYLLANQDQDHSRFKMKYLSLAKCIQITDKSLIYLCKLGFFQQIKYFNLRGCTSITDKFMKYFTGAQFIQKVRLNYKSGNCEKINYLNLENILKNNKSPKELKLIFPLQLKSLDLAHCQITDKSIEYLCRLISVKPDILHRLSLRSCDNITDKGIRLLALNCSNLQHLNVTKCSNITSKSLKEVKVNCKSCIIQHTNFSFC